MKRGLIALLWTFVATALYGQQSAPVPVSAAAVFAEFDRISALSLWPHFEPKKIPLAIYDGERTFLVRHPSPPSGFVKQGEVWVYPGQHPAMRANTHVDLGGVPTATLLLDPGGHGDARGWAATMTHECFHVFQAERHATLTEGAGAHPLVNGIRKVTLTGFAVEPKVRQDGDSLVIDADGVNAKLKGATVERGEKLVTVKVP